jgi:hypothetical protein
MLWYTLMPSLPNDNLVGKGKVRKVRLGNCPPPAMWALSRPASDLVYTSVQSPSDLVYVVGSRRVPAAPWSATMVTYVLQRQNLFLENL